MMMMIMAIDHAPICHFISSTRVGPKNKRINTYFSHEKSCGQKRSRRVAKAGGDMGFPRLGLGSLRVRRLRISQGGATIPRQRLGSCSAGVHRPRLTSLSQTHPPYLVMAADTLAVTASAALDPQPWAGTIRQATDQLWSSRSSTFSWPSPASPIRGGDCVRQSSWSARPRPGATSSSVGDDEELRGRNNATRLEAATYVQNPLPNAPCRFRLE